MIERFLPSSPSDHADLLLGSDRKRQITKHIRQIRRVSHGNIAKFKEVLFVGIGWPICWGLLAGDGRGWFLWKVEILFRPFYGIEVLLCDRCAI
jgi:hypothetical protein